MKMGLRYLLAIFTALVIGLYAFPSYNNDASADTIVRTSTDDECTRTVFIQIEIFTDLDITDGALETLADVWAKEIDEKWNGPTDEEVHQAAEDINQADRDAGRDPSFSEDALASVYAGNLSKYPILQEVRQELIDKANENKQNANGANNCAIVNCCKIYFHTIIQTRKPGDDPREGFDQIEVMDPSFRSFVRVSSDGLTGNQGGTSGRWALEVGESSAAAHEAGHLMGADDFYDDVKNDEGETHSEAHEGHETDLMARSRGWPKGEHLTEILRIAGQPCNCCRETALSDSFMQGTNLAIRFSMDALAGNNCEYLAQSQTLLENQLRNLQLTNVPTLDKVGAANRLQDQIDKVKKALLDCDPPGRPMTGTTGTETAIGIGEGVPTAPLSYDSLECTTYGGGTIPLTGLPIFPFGSSFPIFPVGPVQGPAGGGQTPPETPGQTPSTTPGGGPVSTPEGQPTIPGLGKIPELYIPQDPNLWGGPIIRVTPGILDEDGSFSRSGYAPTFEYDSNDNITRPEDSRKGDDNTPPESTERQLYDERDLTVPIPGTTEEDQTTFIPTWLVFKVEQDVVQENGAIEKGPAEKTVLKFGFPVPDAKPGSDVVRTAEDTNNGAGAEPRFTETDENGFGQIFVDGFESGDTSSWSDARPAPKKDTDKPTAVNVTGFTLDATPMKSRIVYLDAGVAEIDTTGLGNPDDLNGNGKPDWTEIRPELEDEIGIEGLKRGGFGTIPGTNIPRLGPGTNPSTTGQGGSLGDGGVDDEDEDNIVPPNTPANGGNQSEIPDDLKVFKIDRVRFGNTIGVTLGYKYHQEDFVLGGLEDFVHQDNRYLKEKLDDPYYESSGTWGQPYDDQWAIKSVGFTDDGNGAWEAAGDDLAPVIVAFIDSGLDWNHADISWDNVWVNEDEIPDNGIDDDMNGYIDDTIGWDFYTNSPSPWDQDGHGTFTAGMVIAAQNNGIGIAGINPAAKVMVLKALNDFGHTRASYVAKAIKYATDNGARVINLSIGGEHQTYLEYLAVKYAHDRGVVIVVAAGNEAMEVSEYGFVPYEEVIAVASSDFDGKRVFFSNIGPEIDIAAPGLDVLSLRARMTDFMRHLKDVPYEAGSAYVGEDNRYFRSSGTSFSAPIVTGIASLILSTNPDLTNVEVKRMILNSARDVELPGTDQFTGYGVIDAVAALNADPAFEIVADIASVTAVQDGSGAFFVDIQGSASANDFAGATVQIGIGEAPTAWKEVATVDVAVTDGALALIDANEFRAAPVWTIRVVVTHANGRAREQWYVLRLG